MTSRASLASCLALTFALGACGDDTSASGGGGPGGSGSTADATVTSTTTDASSAATTTSATTTAGSSGSSTSTGGTGLCDWAGVDPGNLVSTGNLVGDVIENVSGLVDQCGVARSLWDFAGGYRILSMTPGW